MTSSALAQSVPGGCTAEIAPSEIMGPPAPRRAHLRRTARGAAGAELRIRGLRDEASARRPLREQCRRALDAGARLLADEGASLEDVVRVVYILRDPDGLAECYPLLRAAFEQARPAVALRMVRGFDRPEIEIELELVAHLPACPVAGCAP